MAIGFASIFVLMLIVLGMSIPFSFLSGAAFYVFLTGMSSGNIAPAALFTLESNSLLAIPLFMIGGNLLEISGIAENLINFAEAILKKIKGGMGATIPLAAMFFGALCGSGTATTAALSTIMVPRMERLGWNKRYTAALVASSGSLGYMIPPNMNAIIFALVTDASIAALFLATVIPGIIWGILYMIINRFIYKKWKSDEANLGPNATLRKKSSYVSGVISTFKSAIPAFVVPIIILGGIYGGIFSATEAGAVACVYAFIAGVFFYKRLNLKGTFQNISSCGKTVGAILLVIPMVQIFTRLLILNQVPQRITATLTSMTNNKIIILLVMDFIFFIAGFFLDANVLTLIIAPLMLPTANAIGMDIVQLAVILFVGVGVGTVTPPMAMNLFVASKACSVPVDQLIKPMLPFLIFGAIPVYLLVTFVPELSLFLPRLVMGQ